MTYIKITYNSTTYVVNGTSVTVAGQSNTFSKPNANGTDIVEVQTQSFNNPLYNIGGIHFTGASGTLSYPILLSMLKHKYDGTNAITLEVQYGNGTNLVGSDGVTTSIPVIVKSFNFPINTGDTDDGYMPVASLNLIETK